MGGMYAGHYALKYPEIIEKLIFMSSVGITPTPEALVVDELMRTFEGGLAHYGGRKTLEIMYEYPWSPFDTHRVLGSHFG